MSDHSNSATAPTVLILAGAGIGILGAPVGLVPGFLLALAGGILLVVRAGAMVGKAYSASKSAGAPPEK